MPWPIRILLYTAPIAFILTGFVCLRLRQSLLTLWPDFPSWMLQLLRWIPLGMLLLPGVVIYQYYSGGIQRIFLLQDKQNILDVVLNYPYWLAFISAVELFPYLLLLAIASLIIKKTGLPTVPYVKGIAVIQLVLIVTIFLYVGFRTARDTFSVRFREHQITLKQLPPQLDGMTILLLADIQIDRYTSARKLTPVLPEIQKRSPQLVLFAGDLITYRTRDAREGIRLLCQFPKKIPRVACMGDHDFWFAPRSIPKGLRACGWHFLNDAHHIFRWKGARILVTGVTNIYSRPIPRKAARTLFRAAPAADLKILLVHQPSESLIELARKFGYHLVVAGHTHGGQILFRPFGIPLTPTQYENRFYSGAYQLGSLHVVVTNGIGLTFAPVRYQAPAEISIIKLQTQSD
ncbi:MAG: hypothetical protein GXO78_14865 [Calditrichaeota bacterium]|nr:hypothetical protein [Calditrichota bacterium]